MEDSARILALRDALLAHETGSALRHSLRNRLAAIRNASFFVKRRLDGGAAELLAAEPRIGRMLSLIEDELVAAEALLGAEPRVLAVLEAERGECDLAEVARSVLAERGGASHPLVFTCDEELEVRASARLVSIALTCLVENAFEAVAAGGGSVRVTAERIDEVEVALTVVDEGDGFHGDDVEVGPYRGTKEGRLGVGLSLARRAAFVWGGRLELAPGTPRGTRATLVLPSARPREASS